MDLLSEASGCGSLGASGGKFMSALKILVVDDQPAVCAALELLFDVHGLETLIARTPDERPVSWCARRSWAWCCRT